jgi:hypothetical protein
MPVELKEPASGCASPSTIKAASSRTRVWIIKDGRYRESTGCGVEDYRQAEDRVADYIANKRLDNVRDGIRAPAAIPVADVLALYSRDLVDNQARPKETTHRLKTLIGYFGDKVLSDINGHLCRDYVQHRGHSVAARRELEDLRAAINHHRREGLCSAIVEIVLPPASPRRERWLTRHLMRRRARVVHLTRRRLGPLILELKLALAEKWPPHLVLAQVLLRGKA